jgi:hypothetical protein
METGIAGEVSTVMQLIPESIHSATAHTGTAAYARAVGGLVADIVTDPTTYIPAFIGAFLSASAPSTANASEAETLRSLGLQTPTSTPTLGLQTPTPTPAPAESATPDTRLRIGGNVASPLK